MSDDAIDVLFDVRNALHIGSYQACVAEADKVQTDDEEIKEDAKVLMYRAMIAQGKYAVVKGDITADASSGLQSVKNLARFLHVKRDRDDVLATVKKQMDDGISLTNATVALMNATILVHAEDVENALRCLHNSDNIEAMALTVQILLQMDRVDLAKKELKRLTAADEDATITQLATAWVNLAAGGDKLQDAYYTFQELSDKYGGTPLLLNGQAASHIQQGRYLEAEEALSNALDKNPNNPETLINLVAVSTYLGKPPDVASRYLNQLRDAVPDHPYVRDLQEKEALFDTFSAQMAE